jgi:phosphatidylserine/phosphatidylglycerophosphate/cardiolipin synthase-like enzyme
MTQPSHPRRDIHATGLRSIASDFLQSLFVAEIIHPSRRLWISSPWLSDIEVIDNTARQFASLCPEWPAIRIRLSTVIRTLLERGADIVIIVNESPHNGDLMDRIAPLIQTHAGRLHTIADANVHEKGILGDRFTLNGSMNLTYGGVNINDELLIYRTDPETVAERRVALEYRWREHL